MPFFKLQNGVRLKLIPGRYPNNCLGFYLVCEKIPLNLQDEFFPGEPWACVTVNLPGLQLDEFALNHDFSFDEDLYILRPVMEHLTGKPFPQAPYRYIHSGYVDFPVYKFSDKYKVMAHKI